MSYSTLHAYYRDQPVLPTYGRFTTAADLEAHAALRAQVFEDKLRLPLRLFDGADVLEFGPDSGENALVFARWGSRCHLAEPNIKAHPFILEYFQRYGLRERLVSLEAADIAAYAARDGRAAFDVVVAEGFIYTVQPTALWIELFARLARPGGLVVVNYCEVFGSWVELLTKVVHAQLRRLTNRAAVASAEQAFTAKWNTIPHMRAFESWVIDVLENPFVRLRYFLEPDALCTAMDASGFALHASWPAYHNELEVYWHKRTPSADEQAASRREFLSRSRLSHMFGTALFLRTPAHEQTLMDVVRVTDALIDDFDLAAAARLADGLAVIRRVLQTDVVYAAPGAIDRALAAIDGFAALVARLAGGDVEGSLALCASDRGFLATWGQPYHFAAFRRSRSDRDA